MSTQRDSATRLLILEREDDTISETESEETFVIKQALREVSTEEYNTVYRCLSTADIETELSIPVYQIAWRHIVRHRRGRLQEMVLVYNQLTEVVETVQPDELVCSDDLDRAYRAVIVDVAAEHGIEASCRLRSSLLSRLQRAVISSVLLLPFFLDQLLGLVLKHVTSRGGDADTLFVPALQRLGSMTPVFEEMESEFDVIVASMVSSWLWTLRDDDLEGYDPIPLSQYATVSSLLDQLSTHVRLCRAVFVDESLKHELESVLADELDVRMDRATDYALQQGFRTRMFGSIHLYPQFATAFEEIGCDRVVIGSLSPAGKTGVMRAIADGINPYHVPHGVGAGGEYPQPPVELTHFVSGKLEKKYYEESPQRVTPWTCIVSGRPYLIDLYAAYGNSAGSGPPTEPYHIVLATQPNEMRLEFVERATEAIERAEFEATVTIKVHPSETPETYASYTEANEWITVADSNLHELLADADLTLTVNSNVGLESIIVGTPSVSLNWWGPTYAKPVYSAYGGVPVVDDPDELDGFFEEVNEQKLSQLLSNETAYLQEYYELTGNAAARIATAIETDQTATAEAATDES